MFPQTPITCYQRGKSRLQLEGTPITHSLILSKGVANLTNHLHHEWREVIDQFIGIYLRTLGSTQMPIRLLFAECSEFSPINCAWRESAESSQESADWWTHFFCLNNGRFSRKCWYTVTFSTITFLGETKSQGLHFEPQAHVCPDRKIRDKTKIRAVEEVFLPKVYFSPPPHYSTFLVDGVSFPLRQPFWRAILRHQQRVKFNTSWRARPQQASNLSK